MCKKSRATASHLANLQLSFGLRFFAFFLLQPKMPQYICHLLFFQQYFFSQFSFGSRFVCFLVVCLFVCLLVCLFACAPLAHIRKQALGIKTCESGVKIIDNSNSSNNN